MCSIGYWHDKFCDLLIGVCSYFSWYVKFYIRVSWASLKLTRAVDWLCPAQYYEF